MTRKSVPPTEEPNTCDIVQAWLSANSARLGRQTSLVRRSLEPLKLNAQFETPAFLISITAWDRARCLDIDVMDKATNEGRIVAAGPCSDTASLLTRLEDFAKTLDALQNASNQRLERP